ncbi:hypothetical protein [Crocosphaera chwakensis]|uniref:Uncharacterized protein n=1 Tax=Crocosphaera chwakensis CCY0110 TaxID=391612 RepID=A3ILV9_9CHRO|nr:hypothetical protein [Crocosphaera chwakensis]EAZ92415.1 hypothetical protein CY0110_01779 [Crocosphaera chwakensis CCY0110]
MNNHNSDNDLDQLKTNLFNLGCGFLALTCLVFVFMWGGNIAPILSLETSLDSETFYELKNEGTESIIKSLQFLATGFGGVTILLNVYYAAKRATALEKTAQAASSVRIQVANIDKQADCAKVTV